MMQDRSFYHKKSLIQITTNNRKTAKKKKINKLNVVTSHPSDMTVVTFQMTFNRICQLKEEQEKTMIQLSPGTTTAPRNINEG